MEKNQQKKQIDAIKWLRNSMKNINNKGKVSDYSDILMDRTKDRKLKLTGQVLIFRYKASSRTKIYDKYPLVLVIGKTENGFMGLNIHYVPPRDRLKLILLMNSLVYDTQDNQKIRIKIFSLLTKNVFAKYTNVILNKYNTKNIMGKVKITTPEEWTNFAFLPVFKGINPTELYSEVREEIRKNASR